MSKKIIQQPASVETAEAKPGSLHPVCSAVAAREKVMEAEAALMTAATQFGRAWGCDHREHPKMYWLELHIQLWGDLARCALEYAECFGDNPPNEKS